MPEASVSDRPVLVGEVCPCKKKERERSAPEKRERICPMANRWSPFKIKEVERERKRERERGKRMPNGKQVEH